MSEQSSNQVKRGRGRPRHPRYNVTVVGQIADAKAFAKAARSMGGQFDGTSLVVFTSGSKMANYRKHLKAQSLDSTAVKVDPYTGETIQQF